MTARIVSIHSEQTSAFCSECYQHKLMRLTPAQRHPSNREPLFCDDCTNVPVQKLVSFQKWLRSGCPIIPLIPKEEHMGAHPKPWTDPEPQYEGRRLWRSGDTRIKCRDCDRYATHRGQPAPGAASKNPLASFMTGVRPYIDACPMHAKKAVAAGEFIRIQPFAEYLSYQKQLAAWQTRREAGEQGKLM